MKHLLNILQPKFESKEFIDLKEKIKNLEDYTIFEQEKILEKLKNIRKPEQWFGVILISIVLIVFYSIFMSIALQIGSTTTVNFMIVAGILLVVGIIILLLQCRFYKEYKIHYEDEHDNLIKNTKERISRNKSIIRKELHKNKEKIMQSIDNSLESCNSPKFVRETTKYLIEYLIKKYF